MALRNIVTVPDLILSKISKPVENVDDKIKELVNDMIETLHSTTGCGLAAVQVGILRRIIVVEKDPGNPIVFINPEIIESSGEQFQHEGCLSIPKVSGWVRRPKNVTIKAIDLNGNELIYSASDLMAQIICHEIDHLNGVLFIEKTEIR